MDFHKLLQKQIKKHLTINCVENPDFKTFIQSVNDSYTAFERDRELMNHAFLESEKEYYDVNNNLRKEIDLRKKSISNLYNTLEVLEDNFDDIKIGDNVEDIVFISNYLNLQIEKKKEVEKNLSTTVELLKTLLANLQSGILVEDENRKILFTNQLFCDMFSIPIAPESMVGIDCTNSAEESKTKFKESEEFAPRIDEILKKREIVTEELLETANNQFLEREYIPIFINNEYKGHLWKYTNVTHRIKTQNLLEQSEERSRLIMNSALNAIINIDCEGRITFWNKQAEAIFGWTTEEVQSKLLSETIIPTYYKQDHSNGMKRYMATGEGPVLNKQIELTGLRKNGQQFPIEISIIPVQQNDQTFFCSFIQDISERKKAEKNLKYQEEKYRNIIANMNLGLIEVDNEETILFTNQSFSTISGYEIDELIGKKATDLFVKGNNIDVLNEKTELRQKGISDIYQIPVSNKRGELRWWAISGAPNYDDEGKMVGSVGIHLDITDQKQLEIELEKEKIKAQEASKAKEEFLANMSHEIRTPLNAIIGFLRELEKHELNEIQKKFVENSSVASKHLLAIINNILDISKIEAGEMSLENEDFILESSISNVVTVLQPKAEQKELTLNTFITTDICRVLKGDSLRLEQILFNLVGNSLKFTSEGHISVNCSLIKDYNNSQDISITVTDTGIGMDAEYAENIFRKFSQEDKATTRKFGGTGLGMAITKELVNLMKGSIKISSEKNKGTSITIELNIEKGNIKNIISTKQSEKVTFNNISILLVEDNEMNRMVAQNTLQYYDCNVVEAENGLIAVDILKNQTFDIILMDIQMPELDGIEATKIIRNELNLETPIIALTANAFKTEIEKCKLAGMNDYVTKPFDEKILIETIAKHTYVKSIEIANNNPQNLNNMKLYNLATLNNLGRGNEDFVKKMISIFINQTNETLEKADEALNANDFLEVSRLIHKIKPSIESVGVDSIKNEVITLEKISKETQDKESITKLFILIKTTLAIVIEQLKTDI